MVWVKRMRAGVYTLEWIDAEYSLRDEVEQQKRHPMPKDKPAAFDTHCPLTLAERQELMRRRNRKGKSR